MEFLWLTALFLVPLVFVTPDLIGSGYDVPKVTLYRSLVALMAVLWLVEWSLTDHRIQWPSPVKFWTGTKAWLAENPSRWVFVAACLALSSHLASTLLSPSLPVALWGAEPAFDGYSFYNSLTHFVLFAVIATRLRSASQLWRLFGIICASGIVISGYGVLQFFGLDPFGVHPEAAG